MTIWQEKEARKGRETGWKRKEESYVRDGGMDGGMPVLIRVWEQRLSVRCPPVNEPVSLRYHRNRAGTQGGGRGRSAAQPDNRNVFMSMTEQQQANKSEKHWKPRRTRRCGKDGIKCQPLYLLACETECLSSAGFCVLNGSQYVENL